MLILMLRSTFGDPTDHRCPCFRSLRILLPAPPRPSLGTDPGLHAASTASPQSEDNIQEPNSESNFQGLLEMTALRLLPVGPQLPRLPQAEVCLLRDLGKSSQAYLNSPQKRPEDKRAQRKETGCPRMTRSCNDHSLRGGISPYHHETA